MNSREYWKKREERQKQLYIKQEAVYQKQLNEIYERMYENIEKEINGFYVKYADKEGITMAEAKKRVSKLDIRKYAKRAQIYVKSKDFSKRANEQMRIYNLTMKVNRLEMLKADIGKHLVVGFDEIDQQFGDVLTRRTEEELERQAGILGETVTDNSEMAKSIVNASFKNATYSDRVWAHQGMLKSELDKLLQEGLIQGKHPRVLARHLENRFGVSKSNTERLMRTELARVQTEAQKQSFEKNGFTKYQFLAIGSACGVCKAIDGKHFDVKDMMPGENAPPMHPNCRCSVSAWEDSKEYEEWLDYLDKGGTTEEWNKLKTSSEKEESKEKYKYKDTVVNRGMIESADYRKRFNKMSDNDSVNRAIWANAKEMLRHRSGTKYEDLSYINSLTGKNKINKNFNAENHAKPNKPMKKMLRETEQYTIIGVHNHPGSSFPSLPDILACKDRMYKFGITICHDGKIFKYSVDSKKFNKVNATFALDRLSKKGYTDDIRKQLNDCGISMEVL
ncbi:MAG: minor capsid protein [Anaerostipes sp.]|nr:minor capsid protein [Anaerostipes sp.]